MATLTRQLEITWIIRNSFPLLWMRTNLTFIGKNFHFYSLSSFTSSTNWCISNFNANLSFGSTTGQFTKSQKLFPSSDNHHPFWRGSAILTPNGDVMKYGHCQITLPTSFTRSSDHLNVKLIEKSNNYSSGCNYLKAGNRNYKSSRLCSKKTKAILFPHRSYCSSSRNQGMSGDSTMMSKNRNNDKNNNSNNNSTIDIDIESTLKNNGDVDGSASVSESVEATTMISLIPEYELTAMGHAKEIFQEAVNAVLPQEMVAQKLVIVDNTEDGGCPSMLIGGHTYRLDHNVYVVGFGKAVLGMARAVDDLIGRHIVTGVVSVPFGIQEEFREAGKLDMVLNPDSSIQVYEGAANNMPDQLAHTAAMEIAHLTETLQDGDVLLVLISGGGSALLPAPASPITMDDMLEVTGQMSRGGATISQLNTVRKHLDFLKGGGLAKLAQPSQVVSLILSDIVGDPLDLIASAPTVEDRSKPEDCLAIFSQLNIDEAIPPSVKAFLRAKPSLNGMSEQSNRESVSPERLDTNSIIMDWSRVQNNVIGSNKIACESACMRSEVLGYMPFVLSTELEGEAREVGKMFANLALFMCGHLKLLSVLGSDDSLKVALEQIEEKLILEYKLGKSLLREIVIHVEKAKIARKCICVVSGGETTVTVVGTGRGGRNQEMAVSAGIELEALLESNCNSGILFIENHCFGDGNDDGDGKGGIGCSGSKTEIKHKCHKSNKSDNPASVMNVVFLSAGTDGQDGPTLAAGGVIGLHFAKSAEMSSNLDLDCLRNNLDNNDSYNLLTKLTDGQGLVDTGLTGTNVMDIQVLLVSGLQ